MTKKSYKNQQQKSKFEKITNEKILRRCKQIRIVGDHSIGEYLTSQALEIADGLDLDLVLINEKAVIPICKIMDYRKYLYDAKKKEKKQNALGAKIETKETRLGLDTGDHDLDTKMRKSIEFLEKGNKVKLVIRLRGGRNMIRKLEGGDVIKNFVKRINNQATDWEASFDSMPKLQGRNWNAIISYKSLKNKQ